MIKEKLNCIIVHWTDMAPGKQSKVFNEQSHGKDWESLAEAFYDKKIALNEQLKKDLKVEWEVTLEKL